MFVHGFPPEWSTFKKLIWLVGSGIAGAASGIWKTVTGTLIHLTDALASPVKELSVEINSATGATGCNLYQAPTKNRFTTVGQTTGRYLRANNTTASANGWNYSDYIPVLPNKQYTFNPNSTSGDNAYSLFYDSAKEPISYISSGKQTFTTPSNCAYMRFSYRATSTSTQLELGASATEYEENSAVTTYPISWQTEAGSITSGTLTVAGDGGVTLTSGGNTYQLASITPISTIAGENNIWADVNGTITLTYKADGRDSDKADTGKADFMTLAS